MPQLLHISELTVSYRAAENPSPPVLNSLALHIDAGEIVGLLGESGCGKTTLAACILGLLPDAAEVTAGAVCFAGRDLRRLSPREMRRVRGAEIALIPQEPAIALNPVMPVGRQVMEVIRAHNSAGWRADRAHAEEMLRAVGFREGTRIFNAFPHQLSGGQQQRVVIAQALACGPSLVIADEPTASLDAASRAEILALLKQLQKSTGTALLLITHQPSVLAAMADRVLVMHAGRIVESGAARDVLHSPRHPYAQALLACAWEQPIDVASA